jgi:hypothetical protein
MKDKLIGGSQMRIKWIFILLTIMFVIVFCSKRHTRVEYVPINTVVDTVQIDSLKLDKADTLQLSM